MRLITINMDYWITHCFSTPLHSSLPISFLKNHKLYILTVNQKLNYIRIQDIALSDALKIHSYLCKVAKR